MGIRINKTLGYGIADVKTNKDGEIIDKRFTKDFIKNKWEVSEGFADWVKKYRKEAVIMLTAFLGVDPHHANFHLQILTNGSYGKDALEGNVLHYDSEFGLGNVMLLTPPEGKEWHRHDDIIDYVESETAEPIYTDLFLEKHRCGIYPYEGMMLIPGRKNLIPKNNGTMASQDYNLLLGRWNKDLPAYTKDKKLLKHLKEDWVPKIPETVLLFSLYARMFVNPMTIYEFHPMIYTYWG